MANNRMYIVCSFCSGRYLLAKYYPSTGYYAKHDTNETLDDFFEVHRHEDQSSQSIKNFSIEYEQ